MNDEPDIRFVDAHPERDRRGDDARIIAQEKVPDCGSVPELPVPRDKASL